MLLRGVDPRLAAGLQQQGAHHSRAYHSLSRALHTQSITLRPACCAPQIQTSARTCALLPVTCISHHPLNHPSCADPDISAAARQVNSDLLEQVQQQQQQQQQQRGLSGGTDSLDSQALLAAVRWVRD